MTVKLYYNAFYYGFILYKSQNLINSIENRRDKKGAKNKSVFSA